MFWNRRGLWSSTHFRVEGEGCLSSPPTVQTGRVGCWGIKDSRTLQAGYWNIRQAGTHKMSIHDLKGFLKKSQFYFSSQAFATCQEHYASVDLGFLQYGPIKPAHMKSSALLVEMETPRRRSQSTEAESLEVRQGFLCHWPWEVPWSLVESEVMVWVGWY